jgi:exonuclease VII small subunit
MPTDTGDCLLEDANAMYSQGDAALCRSSLEEAKGAFRQALSTYERFGSVLGQGELHLAACRHRRPAIRQ